MCNKSQTENIKEVFLPYYINEDRLLDLYSILNNGYPEYEEITLGKEKSQEKSANMGMHLKLFKIGGDINGSVSGKNEESQSNRIKMVQTSSSMLNIVKDKLEKEGRLHKEINCDTKPGDFVCLPVRFRLNSITDFFDETMEIINLVENIENINNSGKKLSKERNDLKKIKDALKSKNNHKELVYEAKNFVIISHIQKENLFRAQLSDLDDSELTCLCQIKRVYPNGTKLMRNTYFSRIQDEESKEKFYDAVSQLLTGGGYDFESTVKWNVKDKVVYEVEIIALYR